jgi:hypothetical protein
LPPSPWLQRSVARLDHPKGRVNVDWNQNDNARHSNEIAAIPNAHRRNSNYRRSLCDQNGFRGTECTQDRSINYCRSETRTLISRTMLRRAAGKSLRIDVAEFEISGFGVSPKSHDFSDRKFHSAARLRTAREIKVAFRSAKVASSASFAERKATIILQAIHLFHEQS